MRLKRVVFIGLMLISLFSIGAPIDIKGNNTYDTKLLLSVYEDTGLAGVIGKYRMNGYAMVRVGIGKNEDDEEVLVIDEGRQIKILKTNINSDIYNAELFDLIYASLDNKLFYQKQLDEVVSEIKNYLDANGYLRGGITIGNTVVSQNGVLVNIRIEGGIQYKIGSISMEMDGEEDLITGVGLNEGEIANLIKIRSVITEMQRNNVYANADADLELEGDIVNIKYVGNKGKSGIIRGGLKYDGIENNVYLSIKENNFLGKQMVAEGSINYTQNKYAVRLKLGLMDGTEFSGFSGLAGSKDGNKVYENKIKFSRIGYDGKLKWYVGATDYNGDCIGCNTVMADLGLVMVGEEVHFLNGKWLFKAWTSNSIDVMKGTDKSISVGGILKVDADVGALGMLKANGSVEYGYVVGNTYNKYMSKNPGVRGAGGLILLDNGKYRFAKGNLMTHKKIPVFKGSINTGLFVDGAIIKKPIASYGVYISSEVGGSELELYYAKKIRGNIEEGVGFKLKNDF
jgi:hypothetical protein